MAKPRFLIILGASIAFLTGQVGPVAPHPMGAATAYAWANDATSDSYTPSAVYAYNELGSIVITRSGTGNYSVVFSGMGGNGRAGGNVQVTAYGGGAYHCKVSGWGNNGADWNVYVLCFDSDGSPVDTLYTVLVNWH